MPKHPEGLLGLLKRSGSTGRLRRGIRRRCGRGRAPCAGAGSTLAAGCALAGGSRRRSCRGGGLVAAGHAGGHAAAVSVAAGTIGIARAALVFATASESRRSEENHYRSFHISSFPCFNCFQAT